LDRERKDRKHHREGQKPSAMQREKRRAVDSRPGQRAYVAREKVFFDGPFGESEERARTWQKKKRMQGNRLSIHVREEWVPSDKREANAFP